MLILTRNLSLLITENDVLLACCAYDVCSTVYLCCEMQHIKKVFHRQNYYSVWVIKQVFKEFQVNNIKSLVLSLSMKSKVTPSKTTCYYYHTKVQMQS